MNGWIFNVLYGKKVNDIIRDYLPYLYQDRYVYRCIDSKDLNQLFELLSNNSDVQYFNPHNFDKETLENLHDNPSFLMMGVFDSQKLVGYFFLRFFFNKKAFIGRMVDGDYQRQGLAKGMSNIMYSITWDLGFRCLTTISEQNKPIFDLHKKEGNVVFLKKMKNNYHLVEILPDATVCDL